MPGTCKVRTSRTEKENCRQVSKHNIYICRLLTAHEWERLERRFYMKTSQERGSSSCPTDCRLVNAGIPPTIPGCELGDNEDAMHRNDKMLHKFISRLEG